MTYAEMEEFERKRIEAKEKQELEMKEGQIAIEKKEKWKKGNNYDLPF